MELMQAIIGRHSERDFTGGAITPQQLEAIVRAGMNAPSAHNAQPWVFFTTTDKQKLAQLKEISRYWRMIDSAGAAIVTCCDTASFRKRPPELQISGCCAATQNLLLAAHGLGLGAVWLGICEGLPYYERCVTLLGIPEHLRVVSLVALGVPQSYTQGVDRFDAAKWVQESF